MAESSSPNIIMATVVKNYKFILDNIADVNSVVDHLFSLEVLTFHEKDYVHKGSSNMTALACLERLFDCLFIKDKKVWPKFIESLKKSGYDDVVEKLMNTPLDDKDSKSAKQFMRKKLDQHAPIQINQNFYIVEGNSCSNLTASDMLKRDTSSVDVESYIQVIENNARHMLNGIEKQADDEEDLQAAIKLIEKEGSFILIGSDKDKRARVSRLVLNHFCPCKPLILQTSNDWETVKSKIQSNMKSKRKEHAYVVLLEDILGTEAINKIKATTWSQFLPSLSSDMLSMQCPFFISLSTKLFEELQKSTYWQMLKDMPLYHLKCRKRRSIRQERALDANRVFNRMMSNTSELVQSELHVACFKGDISSVKELFTDEKSKFQRNSAGQTPLQIACSQKHVEIICLLLGVEEAELNVYTEDDLINTELMLLKAAFLGQAPIVEQLLKQGARKEATDDKCRGALHIAALNNHALVVSVLLKQGSNANMQDIDQNTALHYACLKGYEEVVKILLAARADMHLNNKYGHTPLRLASSQNKTSIILLLLKENVDIDQVTDIQAHTSLHIASAAGHSDAVRILIANGAKCDATDASGLTALHQAAENGNVSVVELLLSSKHADINITDKNGSTPLHKASLKNHMTVVKLLVMNGAEVDKVDTNGQSALHLACSSGSVDAISMLSKHGAHSMLLDNQLNTPLHIACEAGHPGALRALFIPTTVTLIDEKQYHVEVSENLVNVTVTNRAGDTPLHCACRSGQLLAVWFLISQGAFHENANMNGNTPLHEACIQGHSGIVKTFLDMKVRTDVHNMQGLTPLHIAVKNGFTNIVDLMIKYKADLNSKDVYLQTPLHLASEHGHWDIVQMLTDNNCDITAKDIRGFSPLHFASKRGNFRVVKTLLAHGAISNATDNNGNSPLFISSYFGHTAVVDVLLQCKSHMLLPEQGRLSLTVACQFGHTDIVKALLQKGAAVVTESNCIPEPLHSAILFHHVEIAKLVLNECPVSNLFNPNIYGQNVLHLSSWKGQTSLVQFLIKCETVDIDAVDANGNTALILASSAGHADIVKMLLAANANLTTGNVLGALINVSRLGHDKVLQLLLNAGVEVDLCDVSGLTALHFASAAGHAKIVQCLIEAKSDINKITANGSTALHFAVMSGSKSVIQMLITAGAEVNIADNAGLLPIHMACGGGNTDIVEMLLQVKSPIDSKDKLSGSTPLHYACLFSHANIVQMLVNHGAKTDISDDLSMIPFHIACALGSSMIAKILTEKMGNAVPLDCIRFVGNSCLRGDLNIVKMLLNNDGAQVRPLSSRLFLLHLACQSGSLELVRYLLDNKARVEDTNDIGRTPLHYACGSGNCDIVQLLLRQGSGHKGDNNKVTPLHIASFNGHTSIVELLLHHDAKVAAKDNNGFTAMHLACRQGHLEIVELLKQQGASIEDRDSYGNTPLLLSCASGKLQLVQYLLDIGVKENSKNKYNQTSLDIACQIANIHIVAYLLSTNQFQNCKLVFLVPNI